MNICWILCLLAHLASVLLFFAVKVRHFNDFIMVMQILDAKVYHGFNKLIYLFYRL